MSIRHLFLSALVALSAACTRDQPPSGDDARQTSLRVHSTQRNSFHIVGNDTLSDSTRILEIHPEQDGDALVTLFADPGRRVTAGLAIIDRKMEAPQLLWPDSVTSVWWSGPHMLAFTTTAGTGIRLAVDIHAAEIRIADTSDTSLGRAPASVPEDSAMMLRARTYIDSAHTQVGGVPQTSTLTYAVTRLVPSTDGRLAAFHTTARDTQGRFTNPAWYALDRESGTVTPIDRVTGPVTELPEKAGQWSQSGAFFYAKGRALWEAEIVRQGSIPSSE